MPGRLNSPPHARAYRYVAIDDDGRINLLDLMRRRGTLAYAAFDVLWLNERG
jgi:hypothetical protein